MGINGNQNFFINLKKKDKEITNSLNEKEYALNDKDTINNLELEIKNKENVINKLKKEVNNLDQKLEDKLITIVN